MADRLPLNFPESIPLADIPTPIEEITRLPEEYRPLPRIFVKRDDLTGAGLSGNKVRKLEFCMAEALSEGADTVITCGGVQSNHARATAVAAAKLGLRSLLVLRGEPPEEIDGNLLLDTMAGAETLFISEEEWERVDEIMQDKADELKVLGRKAYIIPEGASYPTGVFGYIKAAEEIVNFSREYGIEFSSVVIAVGSGGTYAGLHYGFRLMDSEVPITGINVLKDPPYFRRRISELSRAFLSRYSHTLRDGVQMKEISEKEIEIVGGYEGPEYAVPSEEGIRLIRAFARCGLFLDPAYTGKAMLGLVRESAKGRWNESDNVLFIHTGGIFSLFPWRKELTTRT